MSIDPKYYTEDVKTVKKIDFCIFTNKEVKAYSAVSNDPFGINLPESYENYEPKKGGLVDLRLGSCDIYLSCTTCGLNSYDCPGHFGHTDLAEPVFHYGFFPYLKSILQCICLQCSKLLVEKSDTIYKKLLNKKSEVRFKEIKNLTKTTNYCYTCGTPVGKIKKEEKESTATLRLILEREIGVQSVDEKTGEINDSIKKTIRILTPRECYNILRNLSETDCYILGFNPKQARPEDLIIQVFPIPPVVIRPTAKIDFLQASTMEDSLTIKIADIINANRRVRAQMDKDVISNELSPYNQEISNLLQYHVIVYYDNESVSLPRSDFKTGNKATKSISDRIKSKGGRVRSNLMGKRVNFSARSVITSDPYIDIDEVGIPKKIAMILTIPEEVTQSNIKELSLLVRNGRDNYPGANFVSRISYKDGKSSVQRIDLKYRKKTVKLSAGDVVERHSINGDYVLFNRQPTLHKPSMMGHKIQVLDRDDIHTFRVNVSVTKPYNADFDGDEMNIHMAQSIQARNELKRIANVKYQIIGAKDSSPIIGCMQDALSGSYILTKLNNKILGSDVSNFLCNTSSDTKFDIIKDKLYTGQEIFSHIIPKGINNTIYKDNKKVFEIIDGQLVYGVLDKTTLSTVKNSIIHFIWDKFGPDKTRRFIDDSQRLALAFLNYKGFTIGIQDCTLAESMDKQIKDLIDIKILEYKISLTQYENDNDQIATSIVEALLSSELNSFSADIGSILFKSLTPENSLFVCIDSGSKGSVMNLQHIMGCIGQKSIDGARIKKKVENRSLPIFHKDDDSPEARGFIKSSFIDGVNSYEFFYDAMAGREGLIDTAIKSVTWETPIMIIENGNAKYTKIGEWIDLLLSKNINKIQHFEKNQMELLDTTNIYIPTTDYNGNVSWGQVSAITRHNPGTELYEIKTKGGRNVTVTESKSLLIWNNETSEFKEMITPDIKVGDFVPVTAKLLAPPIIHNYILLSFYLPSNIIYNAPHEVISKNISHKFENSISTCSLKRNQMQLYQDSEDCQNTNLRKKSKMPIQEIFELNYDNGIFIGLFLALGHILNDYIIIKNNNDNIKQFIKYWFYKNSIISDENFDKNKCLTISGYSHILSSFLNKFAGNNERNKFVPNEAFVAPECFVIGLLSGYFSNGYITTTSINIISSSKRLSEGINMLCSRIGVFGNIYKSQQNTIKSKTIKIKLSFKLVINSQWAKTFSDKIILLNNIENNKMKEIIWNISDVKTLNNVVLDEIIEIKLIDIINHPKVYDLTIPSTFNFGLANGLQVRDTAKTGYIQRQLIKGLEDLSIKYDNTNRNSKNTVIQYVYGENGIEQSSQFELKIELITLNNLELETKFVFTPEQVSKLKKLHNIKDFDAFNNSYLAKIKAFRDLLRNIQKIANNNYKTLQEKFMLPVNLFRLTQDYSNNKVNLDLNPEYILESIEKLLNDPDTRLLPGLKETDKYLLKDDRAFKLLFEISLHDYLCPKKCIFQYGLSKNNFDQLINDIKKNFIKALIQPGEMVGIVAAQSIGEPTSQMSTVGNSQNKIIIKNTITNCITHISSEIGTFCDDIIKNNPLLTHGTGHVNSVETDLNTLENEYYIIGVDDKEKTHWNKISHISRHPVNGDMMKVTTKSGRTVHTTTSHSHLIRKDQTVVPIVGASMTVGMRIPVAKHIDNTFIEESIEIDNKTYKLDYLFGWFIGAYLAEGSLSSNTIRITNISEHFINNTKLFAKRFGKECKIDDTPGEYGPGITTYFNCKELAKFILATCGNGSFVKRVPDFGFIAPNEFKAGLIQSYVDGDGNFQTDVINKSRYQIRVCSRSEQLIKDMSLLFNYFDMFGSIKSSFTRGSNIYNFAMSSRYAVLYEKHIGSLLHKEKLNDMVKYTTRDDAHNLSDEIDKINGLGNIIAKCGLELKLPGQSRNYGRWSKKETIGRRTLEKYIKVFEAHPDAKLITNELTILKQAANSNVIWDEVKKIEIYKIKETDYVYDFTVPGNQTFMTDYGIIVHNTLNTKHSAGVASAATTNMGVPRIEELLHYSRDIKTPQMTVYFNKDIASDRSKVNKISSYFTHLTIKELINSAEIFYDTGSNDTLSKLIVDDKVANPYFINNQKAELSLLPFVFRIKLNMEKMFDKETTLLDIKTKFISHWTKNFTNLKNMKKFEKDIFTKISRCAILSNVNIDNQIIHIRFNMSSFNYNLLTEFLKIVLNNITLKGINNITSSSPISERKLEFDDKSGEMNVTKEFVVYTGGINMEKIKYIKGINNALSTCNDISTIYRMYGIEATRQILFNEFRVVFGSSKINHNHMSVLIDMMTHTGGITSIDRHGLGKVDFEPIAKASFEKTMDHFLNAAIYNEKDHIESVSSRIMLGRVIPGGTGAFELLLDTDKLENSEYTKNENAGRITFPALEEESLFKDILKYGFSKNDFFLPINI